MSTAKEDVTELLARIRTGDKDAESKLVPLVYAELRRIASFQMRRERADHTLQPTALVNEAYVKIVGSGQDWKNRAHFFAMASAVMRRLLVDHARAHLAEKRGGNVVKVNIDASGGREFVFSPQRSALVVALDGSLQRLVSFRQACVTAAWSS